jgi:mRNA interferase MazF
MEVTRGDIVVAAASGPYTSKPRPAIVVQADVFNSTHASVTVCPITSTSLDAVLFRVALPPGERTGLREPSQVMIDKVITVPRKALGRTVGRCNADELDAIADALRRWLDL